MKISVTRSFACSLAFLAPTTLVWAHPGHEGHEFTWDIGHLAAHPAATLGWLALGLLGGGCTWFLVRRARSRSEKSS